MPNFQYRLTIFPDESVERNDHASDLIFNPVTPSAEIAAAIISSCPTKVAKKLRNISTPFLTLPIPLLLPLLFLHNECRRYVQFARVLSEGSDVIVDFFQSILPWGMITQNPDLESHCPIDTYPIFNGISFVACAEVVPLVAYHAVAKKIIYRGGIEITSLQH